MANIRENDDKNLICIIWIVNQFVSVSRNFRSVFETALTDNEFECFIVHSNESRKYQSNFINFWFISVNLRVENIRCWSDNRHWSVSKRSFNFAIYTAELAPKMKFYADSLDLWTNLFHFRNKRIWLDDNATRMLGIISLWPNATNIQSLVLPTTVLRINRVMKPQ